MPRGLSKGTRSASRAVHSGVSRVRSISSPFHALHLKVRNGESLTPQEKIYLERQQIPDLEADRPNIVTNVKVMHKYTDAAAICTQAIAFLMQNAKPGASVHALCSSADKFIEEKADAVHTKISKKRGITAPRGVAFPTTVSVNQMVANHAPLPPPLNKDEGDDVTIALGDVVRLHVAAHVDGYGAQSAHTFVVTESSHLPQETDPVALAAAAAIPAPAAAGMDIDDDAKAAASPAVRSLGPDSLRLANIEAGGVCENVARAICAAHACIEAGAAALVPGVASSIFPRVVRAVCDAYGVEPMQGVLSHRHIQGNLCSTDAMIARVELEAEPQQDVATFTIKEGMVFGLDVVVTTSSEHTRLRRGSPPTRIFVRNEVAQPCHKPSTRSLLKYLKVDLRGVPFPFHVRGAEKAGAFPDAVSHMSGVAELSQRAMLEPFPPLNAHRPNDSVARFSATVAILSTGPRIIGVHLPLPESIRKASAIAPESLPPRRFALKFLPRTAVIPALAAQRRQRAEIDDLSDHDSHSDVSESTRTMQMAAARGASQPGPSKRPRTLSKAERKLVMGALPPPGCGRGASRSRSRSVNVRTNRAEASTQTGLIFQTPSYPSHLPPTHIPRIPYRPPTPELPPPEGLPPSSRPARPYHRARHRRRRHQVHQRDGHHEGPARQAPHAQHQHPHAPHPSRVNCPPMCVACASLARRSASRLRRFNSIEYDVRCIVPCWDNCA